MSTVTDVVATKYLAISTGTPVAVNFPMLEASELVVYYGVDALIAVQNTDYTYVLALDFQTFTVTPTASLIAKIDALILADPTNEINYITVRRVMGLLTTTTPALARYTPFTSTEFDRAAMRDQQLTDALNRALTLSPNFVGDAPKMELKTVVADTALVFNSAGDAIIAGPTVQDIADAEANAIAAAASAAAAAAVESAINLGLVAELAEDEIITGGWMFASGGAKLPTSKNTTGGFTHWQTGAAADLGVWRSHVTSDGSFHIDPMPDDMSAYLGGGFEALRDVTGALGYQYFVQGVLAAEVEAAGVAMTADEAVVTKEKLEEYVGSGSFTIGLTGCTSTINGLCEYTVIGGVVTLVLPSLLGTSNATTCTLTGIPSELRPEPGDTPRAMAIVTDNSVHAVGYAQLGSGAAASLFPSVSGGAWTAANIKGIPDGCSLTYKIG